MTIKDNEILKALNIQPSQDQLDAAGAMAAAEGPKLEELTQKLLDVCVGYHDALKSFALLSAAAHVIATGMGKNSAAGAPLMLAALIKKDQKGEAV